jgi:hypothetical protein
MIGLKLETEPAPEDVRYLAARLYDYNVEHTGRDDGQWLAIFSRDERDRIVAGLHGWTWAGWLKINYLWVSADERRRGEGGRCCSRRRPRLGSEAVATRRSTPTAFKRQTSITSSDTASSPRSKGYQKVIDNTRS